MNLPTSAIIYSINSFVLLLFAYKLYYAKKKVKGKLIDYFSITILVLAMSFIFFSLGIWFFRDDPNLFSLSKVIGDFVLFLSFAFGIKVPLYLFRPKTKVSLYFALMTLFAVFLTIFEIFNPPYPVIDSLGAVFWNLHPVSSWGLIILAALMWIPTGLIFLSEGVKNKSEKERIRSLLLALSFLIISISGPFSVIPKTGSLIITFLSIMTFGFILLFVSMFYKGAVER